MKISKYLQIFANLSHSQWAEFVRYAKKHHKNQILLLRCITVLDPYHPTNINKSFPDTHTLFTKIYPSQEYDRKKIAALLLRLQNIGLAYIESIAETQSKSIIQTNQFLKEINATHLHKANIKKLKSTESTFITQYQIDHYLAFEQMEQILELGIRSHEPNFQAVHDHLDRSYLLEKLIVSCLTMNYAKVNKYEYQIGFIPTIIPYLLAHISEKDKILFAFLHAYIFIEQDDEKSFNKVISFIKKEKPANEESVRTLFLLCINYCIGKINTGNLTYFKSLFDIYTYQIKSKCIYDKHGKLSAASLKNIVTVAIRINELKWAENFVRDQTEFIEERNKKDTLDLTMARILFSEKKYTPCLKLLLSSKPNDFLDNLTLRVLQIKCFYATEDIDSVEYALNNFSLYLMRHKNKGYHYKLHQNFIKILKKYNGMNMNDKKSKELMKTSINNTAVLAEKVWLLEIL